MILRDLPDGRTVGDTAGMAALTGRHPATVRVLGRGLRGADGYDADVMTVVLAGKPDPVLLTAQEAERYLGIPAGTIYVWVHRGRLAAVDRVGRSPRYWHVDLERLKRRDTIV